MKNIIKITSFMLVFTSLLSVQQAEAQTCVTPPSCEALGFNKNSADCGLRPILRCPFDQSKVYCGVLVDEQGKAACEVGSILYSDRTCANVICDREECPAGQIPCSTTSKDVTCLMVRCNSYCPDEQVCPGQCRLDVNYGDSRIPIAVVVNAKRKLAMSLTEDKRFWGANKVIDGLQYHPRGFEKNDYDGVVNTRLIAEKFPASAAGYCYNFTTVSTKAGDWYLPAAGELHDYIALNRKVINRALNFIRRGEILERYYYSSSAYEGIYRKEGWAVTMHYDSFGIGYGTKEDNNENLVRCLIAF